MAEERKITPEQIEIYRADMANDDEVVQEHKKNVAGLVYLCDEIKKAGKIKKALERRRSNLAK